MTDKSPPAAANSEAAKKAAILSGALPYMRRYSGKTIVVKYGGHAMGESGGSFAGDVVLLQQHHVAGEGAAALAHGVAAVLDDDGLARVAAHIGQRPGEDRRLLGGLAVGGGGRRLVRHGAANL